MKKAIPLSVGLLLILAACASLQHRGQHIAWPEEINRLKAMCELDMSWKGMKYNGTMSLTLVYPFQLQMEVYGPFGDTLVYLRRDHKDFLMVTKEERITDVREFEKRFGIRLDEFIDDLAMRGPKQNINGIPGVLRERYKVLYRLADNENSICWEGDEGRICVKFMEAEFDGEGHLAQNRDRGI